MITTTASITELLRSPRAVASRIREGRELRPLATASFLSIMIGSATYGGVVGSYRGGLQIAFAALKFPMVAVLTLALVAPALVGLAAALDRRVALAQTSALALAATARASLVLLAIAPALALAMGMSVGYQTSALLAAIGFGLAGLAGLVMLWRPSSDIVFVRPPGEALVEELPRTARSAAGDYDAERSRERAHERAADTRPAMTRGPR